MLVLNRKKGEKILVNDDITITIVKVGGSIVRIGLDAPKNVKIVRAELVEERKESDVPINGVD